MSSTDAERDEPPATDPFTVITTALERVEDVDLGAMPAAARCRYLRDVEAVGRRLGAVQAALLADIDRDGLHAEDAFWSPRTMIRHLGQLSGPDAASRDRISRALRDLPVTAAAYRAAEIGTAQTDRLARCWANPRVRDLLIGAEAHLVAIARTESYKWFDDAVTAWERLADQDGTIDRETRREDVKVRRDPTGMFEMAIRLRSGRAAVTEEIFEHYLAAEIATDWDTARQEWGDDTTWDRLPRTDAERSTDAFMAMILDAATAPPDAREPKITINITIDHHEYLRQLALLAGETPPPPSHHETWLRSHTTNGIWIDPWDVASYTIGADLRRVVLDTDSAVINLSHRNRCYTGTARDAVMLRHPECVWAGCHTPNRACQADHITPHSHGGPTHATNGQPLCGRHNRHKHRTGYHVWRDPHGHWHTLRPDGTTI